MIWALLSILSGAGDALAFASMKKLNNLSARLILILRHLVALPFLLLGFLFYNIPKPSADFYLVTVVNVAVFIVAMYLLIKSLQGSDLSKSIPMLNLTPTFLLLTSYVMIGEIPSLQGFIGIIVTIIGAYILNLRYVKGKFFEPFRMIFRKKEIFYMVIVAFLFSITSNLFKLGVQLSNPAYFVFVNYFLASAVLSLLFFREFKNNELILKNAKWIFIMGISTAAMELLIAVAVNFAIIPYIIALKRTSVIFSVILGFFLFKEKNFRHAFAGAAMMLVGAAIIILS